MAYSPLAIKREKSEVLHRNISEENCVLKIENELHVSSHDMNHTRSLCSPLAFRYHITSIVTNCIQTGRICDSNCFFVMTTESINVKIKEKIYVIVYYSFSFTGKCFL